MNKALGGLKMYSTVGWNLFLHVVRFIYCFRPISILPWVGYHFSKGLDFISQAHFCWILFLPGWICILRCWNPILENTYAIRTCR